MQGKAFWERVTFHVHYPVDGVDTSVFPRKHAKVAGQGCNKLISVLGSGRRMAKSTAQPIVHRPRPPRARVHQYPSARVCAGRWRGVSLHMVRAGYDDLRHMIVFPGQVRYTLCLSWEHIIHSDVSARGCAWHADLLCRAMEDGSASNDQQDKGDAC